MMTTFFRRLWLLPLLMAVVTTSGAEPRMSNVGGENASNVRTLRLVQDDAQDYMVSKIYRLKYVQSNDLVPFLTGIVMRYNQNSSVGCVTYGNNAQLLTVTCPAELMPYVDDFVAKADRDIPLSDKTLADTIVGTGITRAVYQPKYRSGENLLNVLVETVIGAGPHSSVYAYDANSNQIYWKDNTSNTQYVYQFLGYLDRPAPQITVTATLYEVRDSDLDDIGLEYLAWKNGPGLDLFQAGMDFFSVTSAGTAAIQAASGPVGGFFFAPQFDASFLRLLSQSGRAAVKNEASLTVSNSDSSTYTISFDPEYQNIFKSDNDYMSVGVSAGTDGQKYHQVCLELSSPIVNLHYGQSQADYPENEAFSLTEYRPGDYARLPGVLACGYRLQTANVVERNNVGCELVEMAEMQGNICMELGKPAILAQWDETQQVEQRIGIPYLIDIPYLGLLFGTRTTSTLHSRYYLVVTAEMLNTAHANGLEAGKLIKITGK